MNPTRTWTITETNLRDLVRRRGVLVLLFLVPLVFYAGRRGDHTGQSVRFLLLGLAFTISTAALFASCALRSLEPRLRLSGYRAAELSIGRLGALLAVGLLVCVPYLGVVAVDLHPDRLSAIAAAMVLTVAVAAPLGMLLGAVVPRELEGALLLMALVGAQMITDPGASAAKALPFWSARELATYAVDHTGADYLRRGLLHGAGCAVVLFTAASLCTAARLRARRGTSPGRAGHARA
ncbi:ABC transporter permease [Streptomyces sp. HPF1205]|uniref:ABC transporter permease n=1 Tax=Streptomyces sp. HPF1205 TaxID=2873262 RepID=UPI001CEC559A|nr:ABC transporter permease [Streptomyces sp. HPF1205]